MEILGIIPARGNSKGIPRKNLALLAGKSLLQYTAEAAKGSKSLTRTMVSTDDQEIAEAGKKLGLEVPFLRPEVFAKDDTPMLDVLLDLLQTLEKDGYSPDLLVLLQPTSPLRTSMDIDEAIRLLQDMDADTVVSVVPIPHQFTPACAQRMIDGALIPFLDGPEILQRQKKEPLYARNGPAIVVCKVSSLQTKGFYGGKTVPYVMPLERSLDIDGPEELAYAEFLLHKQA